MNLLWLLERFLNGGEERGITIAKDFCVRLKSPMAGCYECINKCPKQAINISDDSIVILDSCDNCGACVYMCPNYVFDFKKNKKEKPATGRYYFCSRVNDIAGEGEIKDDEKITCLYEINDRDIISRFHNGKKITLIKGDCGDCKFEYFYAKKIKRIKDIFKFFGDSYFFEEIPFEQFDFTAPRMETEEKGSSVENNGALDDGKKPEEELLRRREFFKNSLKGIKSRAKEIAGDLSPENLPFYEIYSQFLTPSNNGEPKINRLLLREQKNIFLSIKNNPGLLPIFNIRLPKINKDCVFCQNCWELCPTKALKYKNRGIYLEPFLCTGCNLCKDLCTFGVLKMIKARSLIEISGERILAAEAEEI